MTQDRQDFRSGFVALCGRPNVGKSTLLNALMGEELAVATRFPQTTRERMLGIWTTDAFQAVLVDTPGIHRARSALNKFMNEEALRGAEGVDVILMLAEAPRLPDAEAAQAWEPGPGAMAAFEALRDLGVPIVLVLTKCDLLAERDLVLPVMEKWKSLHDFAAMVPTSAVEKRGLEALEQVVCDHLPQGPVYYDPEQLSDRDMRWHAAELIRGTLFQHLAQELPYGCAVTIDGYRELGERDRIHATVHVERRSQKGIVIGAKGRTIKAIGSEARVKIEELTGRKADLFLSVKVTEGWSSDPKKLERLGYKDRTEDG